jgi:hypothetical protein
MLTLVALAPSRLTRQNKGANIARALLDLIVVIASSLLQVIEDNSSPDDPGPQPPREATLLPGAFNASSKRCLAHERLRRQPQSYVAVGLAGVAQR